MYIRDWYKSVQYYIKYQKEIKAINIKQFMNYKKRKIKKIEYCRRILIIIFKLG